MNDPTRRALRTAVQTLVALVSVLPMLAEDPRTASVPALAIAAAIAGTLSRLMSDPAVERLLPAWLRREATQK